MTDWLAEIGKLRDAGQSCVALAVAATRGSAPRETGARMLVTVADTFATIGGGQLEYQCVRIACDALRRPGEMMPRTETRRFALGANCGQCCGGVVDVLFEYLPGSAAGWVDECLALDRERVPFATITPLHGGGEKHVLASAARRGDALSCPASLRALAGERLAAGQGAALSEDHLVETFGRTGIDIAVFGAGHVGSATVDVLSRLDCRIRWVDNRRALFPRTLPANVQAIEAAEPAREVDAMPAGAFFIVMTHSHPLDLAICSRILRRNDVAYCGLIGSRSKRRRFERLMKKDGLGEDRLRRLVCPIGAAGIAGKAPADIAVAVAAEVLARRDAALCRPAVVELQA